MTFRSTLLSGAGASAQHVMGGLAHMRRPALHRPTATPTGPGWSHPYTGTLAHAVLYNDGGQGTDTEPGTGAPPAPAPSPANMPGAGGNQPAPQAKPGRPRTDPNLLDGEVAVSEDWLGRKFTAEKDAGRRAGAQSLAEELGFTDIDGLQSYITAQKEAEKARLSETERREQEIAERERLIAEREARAAAAELAANRRSLLVSLGATGDDLDDATALLRVANDASDDDVRVAAEALKKRRPELFGVAPEPQGPPPAPGGAPAGGPPQRTPNNGKDAVRRDARKMAIELGFRRADDAA